MQLLPRIQELKKLYRYKAYPHRMIFRPNLFMHSQRVAMLTDFIIDKVLSTWEIILDRGFIKDMALVHDDEEIITGDYVSYEKMRFSKERQKSYEEECHQAETILLENYSKDFREGYYRQLLWQLSQKSSLEYLIVDLADKLDAHCEVCHEFFNANFEFLYTIPLEGFWEVTPYVFTYQRASERIWKLESYLWRGIDFTLSFQDITTLIWKYPVSSFEDLLSLETGYQVYDLWIQWHLHNYKTQDDWKEITYLLYTPYDKK